MLYYVIGETTHVRDKALLTEGSDKQRNKLVPSFGGTRIVFIFGPCIGHSCTILSRSSSSFLSISSTVTRQPRTLAYIGAYTGTDDVARANTGQNTGHKSPVPKRSQIVQEAQLSPRDRAMLVSIKILPIATQQCRNYLYDKS